MPSRGGGVDTRPLVAAYADDDSHAKNADDDAGGDVDIVDVRYSSESPEKPAIFPFRPRVVTLMFTVVSLVNYFDRGLFASVLKPISEPEVFDLSKTLAGLINSMFIVGFMVFSPIFAHLAHRFDPMHLTGVGLLIWVASAVVAGLSNNFWIFLAARTVCGIGEASFVSLVPPFIEDYAPPAQRTKWLSQFYLSVPVGAALGYVVGGPASKRSVQGWRWPFFAQGAAMFPLALYVLCVPHFIRGNKVGAAHRVAGEEARLRQEQKGKSAADGAPGPLLVSSSSGSADAGGTATGTATGAAGGAAGGAATGTGATAAGAAAAGGSGTLDGAAPAGPAAVDTAFVPSMMRLLRNPVFLFAVIGYSCYQFVVGGISTWGVTYLEDPPHSVDPDEASTAFGACAAGGGLVGTVMGGVVTDFFGGSTGSRGMQRAMKVCTLFTLASVPFFEAGFIVSDVRLLYVFVFLGQCLLWTSSAPLNSAIMTSVDDSDRGLALAVSVFAMHLFGDFPSSVGIGAMEDKINNWTLTMVIVIGYLIACGLAWSLSWYFAYRNTQRVRRLASAPFMDGKPGDGL